jgi:23S rRNA (cytosine1962-C5)-methyltransferase
LKIVTLKKNEDHRLVDGHLWAFSNEIASIDGQPLAGDIVQLKNHAGKFLGLGFFNPRSLIAVRILTPHDEPIDFQFFQRRIESALALRRKLYPDSETFRLIHGESDFLPGLIIDKYNDLLSIQTLSTGMDGNLPLICDILEMLLHPRGIVERNDVPVRTLEGLEQRKGILRGTCEPTIITESGLKYEIDLLEGQKTGFFLDQRENRNMIRRYAHDGNVLDCFCNDGGFSLNAAAAGAKNVVGVDISEPAIKRAKENALRNNLPSPVTFLSTDVFEYLKKAVQEKERFDLVILDPPSFTKSKKSVRKAIRGYREINTHAFNLLRKGGILATASCSHHIYQEKFIEVVHQAAHEAGKTVSLLEWHGASADHPVLPAMPETSYLKFGVFFVQ